LANREARVQTLIERTSIVTLEELSGYTVVRSLGEVRAESICAKDVLRATLRSIGVFIGIVRVESSPETQRAREATIAELAARADQLGANAVIGLRFDARERPDGATRVIAQGRAVLVAPQPK
jgi:uncharacterized protein YbjQ (UPF0145 family)